VVRPGAQDLAGISLQLPQGVDLTKTDGTKLLNDRLRQVETAFQSLAQQDVSLPTKSAYGSLEACTASALPVEGGKVNLDKVGTWLIHATFDFQGSGEVQGFVVIDAETADGAKKQDAFCRATGNGTATAWCLFTATSAPRLAQLYAKATNGSWAVLEEGTSICAVFQGVWSPGDKRQGRQTPNEATGATDMNGDPLTDHGDEARWPPSDNPATIAAGVEQPDL
jgi:hypothetical protein